jgi:DinB family
MREILLEAFRHHAWANKQLLAACRGLPAEQRRLPGTAAGTDRGILAILNHIIRSDRGYASRRGERPAWVENAEDTADLEELERRADENAQVWSGSSPSRSKRPSSSSWTEGPMRPNRACSWSRRSTTGTPTASRSAPSSPALASNRLTSRPGRTQKPRATPGNDRRRPGPPSAMCRRGCLGEDPAAAVSRLLPAPAACRGRSITSRSW